jgi:hypothetical protein
MAFPFRVQGSEVQGSRFKVVDDKIEDGAGSGNPILAIFGARPAGLLQPAVFIGSDLRYEKKSVYPMISQRRDTA